MNPDRSATPVSVAAHALYEQAGPYSAQEPEGTLHLDAVEYEPVDARQVSVRGARWETAHRPTVKIEGAMPVGERGVLLAGAADPNFIAAVDDITTARGLRLDRCIAPAADQVKTVLACSKKYLLHHGFPGHLSTDGNIAFPFTPPEVLTGTAYRFSLYHIMQVDELAPLFPITLETL